MNRDGIAVRIKDVSHEFGEPGDAFHVRALLNTNLDIQRGELLCLIGPSGCGKSTLLNMIGGLLMPTGGIVEVSGKLVRAPLPREIASRYSDRIVIFDSPPLLATTEARVLAANMGQIVMVVAADATSQHAVTQALATIEACEVVLMVLNKAKRTDVGTYYGYYSSDGAG